MLKQTRHALAVLLPLIFIMPVLLSCGGAGGGGTTLDGGYLGNTLSLSGPIWLANGKEGAFQPGDGDGTMTFSMQGSSSVDLVTTAVSGADFSQALSAPTAGVLSLWISVMEGLPSPYVSDESANGIVLNTIVFHVDDPKVDRSIYLANLEFTTLVFYVYSDRAVSSSAYGIYKEPAGTDTDTCDMSMSLKAGWNRVIMTRTGPVLGPYTDTWRVGEAPSDVRWAYGWGGGA